MTSAGSGTAERGVSWSESLESELLRLVESRGPAVAKAHFNRLFGFSPKTVDRKLRQLRPDLIRRAGCKANGKPWKEGEDDSLADLLEGTATVTSIAQRLSNLNQRERVRSPAAVRSKLRRSPREMNLPGLKAADVAELLCVRPRQVRRWTDNGYLEAKAGRITEGSLRDLLRNRPHLIPFQAMDREAQNLLVCLGYSLGEETTTPPAMRPRSTTKQVGVLLARVDGRFSRKEVAMVMGVSVRQVRHWVEKGWLSRRGPISIAELRELVQMQPRLMKSLPGRVRQWLTGANQHPG